MARRCIARLIVAALGIALGTAGCVPPEPDKDDDNVLADVEVTLAEALDIARAAVPDGFALEGELALGEPVYDVDLLTDGEVREVFIDPKTGEIIDILTDAEDVVEAELIAATIAAAMVSLDEAIEIAEDAGNGVAVAIDIDLDAHTFQVFVIEDNESILVTVDLETGEPVVDEMPPAEN